MVANLPEAGLTAARTEITRLDALFQRIDGVGDDDEVDKQVLEAFAAQLPLPTPEQTLEFLANTRRWDLADGELQQRLTTAAAALPGHDRVSRLLGVLDRKPEAAYEIGRILGRLAPDDYDARERLLRLAATEDQSALVGIFTPSSKAERVMRSIRYSTPPSQVCSATWSACKYPYAGRKPMRDGRECQR